MYLINKNKAIKWGVILLILSFPFWFTFFTGYIIGKSYHWPSSLEGIPNLLALLNACFYVCAIWVILKIEKKAILRFCLIVSYTLVALFIGFLSGWAGILYSGYCC
ncbi:hypothetical protein [Acinetobacter indicus]|uniref:hypothetical protein n=1 Tax=Acinetobacter indicus TaxID=756892 RepID=UPI0012DAFADE|nr:hypothetical protein [Acinetobacter indicus]MDM1331360.1 hypothetical protein [Acinetobacter indicus]MDM1339410.1 hypothetical protein [Acinetobacter indicus]